MPGVRRIEVLFYAWKMRLVFSLSSSYQNPLLHALSGQIVLVVINNVLVRGRLLETTPSPHGLVQVLCIDLGSTYLVPQAFIRTLDEAIASAEAMIVGPSLTSVRTLCDWAKQWFPGKGFVIWHL
jgi:hypothetical protein